jgi:hypothetical protein
LALSLSILEGSALKASSATRSSEADVEPIMVGGDDILSTFREAENEMNATV